MQLGILGLVLEPLMVIMGTWTILDSIHRRGVPRVPQGAMLAGDLLGLAFFSIFVIWGLLKRRDKVAHKRLMLFSTIAILGPAINRLPFAFIASAPAQGALFLAFPALIVAYDLISVKRLHRGSNYLHVEAPRSIYGWASYITKWDEDYVLRDFSDPAQWAAVSDAWMGLHRYNSIGNLLCTGNSRPYRRRRPMQPGRQFSQASMAEHDNSRLTL
jgi:hypothetical protein